MFIGNRHKNGSEVNNFINMIDADEEMGKFLVLPCYWKGG